MPEEFTPPVDETPAYSPEQQEQYNIDPQGNQLGEQPAAVEPTDDLILGKFKSVEDLAKSYQELEAVIQMLMDAIFFSSRRRHTRF